MSAFVLSDLHFATIAHAVAERAIDVQAIADRLKAINIDSVNFRYNEKTRKSKVGKCDVDLGNYCKADIHNLIACWDYQACEGNSLDYRVMAAYLNQRAKERGFVEGASNVWSI